MYYSVNNLSPYLLPILRPCFPISRLSLFSFIGVVSSCQRATFIQAINLLNRTLGSDGLLRNQRSHRVASPFAILPKS